MYTNLITSLINVKFPTRIKKTIRVIGEYSFDDGISTKYKAINL